MTARNAGTIQNQRCLHVMTHLLRFGLSFHGSIDHARCALLSEGRFVCVLYPAQARRKYTARKFL